MSSLVGDDGGALCMGTRVVEFDPACAFYSLRMSCVLVATCANSPFVTANKYVQILMRRVDIFNRNFSFNPLMDIMLLFSPSTSLLPFVVNSFFFHSCKTKKETVRTTSGGRKGGRGDN